MDFRGSDRPVNLRTPVAEKATSADQKIDRPDVDGGNGRPSERGVRVPGQDAVEVRSTTAASADVTPLEHPQAADAAPDPFDPARLRLGQDFGESLGVKKAILTIPMRKPGKDEFVRVHPDPSYRIHTAVLELKSEREIYLVEPSLRQELAAEPTFGTKMIFTTMSRQGVLFFWPVRSPGPDGRIDDWNRSALEAAELATKKWLRVAANLHLGANDVFEATGDLPEPTWPDMSFSEILKIAFKDRYIDSMDHPVLRRLRGEL